LSLETLVQETPEEPAMDAGGPGPSAKHTAAIASITSNGEAKILYSSVNDRPGTSPASLVFMAVASRIAKATSANVSTASIVFHLLFALGYYSIFWTSRGRPAAA